MAVAAKKTDTVASESAPTPIETPKPEPKVEAVAKPVAQTLREAQPKKFPPSALQEVGQDFVILTVKVPKDWELEDLLKPVAWSGVCGLVAKDALNTRRDKIGSLIYARWEDGSKMALLSIEGITADDKGSPNGLAVRRVQFL